MGHPLVFFTPAEWQQTAPHFNAFPLRYGTPVNQNVSPEKLVPEAEAFKGYLNAVFGVQTNTYFNVTPSNFTVNYDLNRNGTLDITGLPDTVTVEEEAIFSRARTPGAINLYFLRTFAYPNSVGKAAGNRTNGFAYIEDDATQRFNTPAHEIGHVLGLYHSNERVWPSLRPNPSYFPGADHTLQLMYGGEQPPERHLLIKGEWDVINPDKN